MRSHKMCAASKAAVILFLLLGSSWLFVGCLDDHGGGQCSAGKCWIPVPGPGVYRITYTDSCSGEALQQTLASPAGDDIIIIGCGEAVSVVSLATQCVSAQPAGCYSVSYNNQLGQASVKTVCTDRSSNLVLDNCNEITAITPLPPACGISPSGLVSWWPLDGNANDLRGINNGQIIGGTFLPAKVNAGFKSSGQGSRIEAPNSASLTLTQFTISAWIRVDGHIGTPGTPMAMVWKGDSSGNSTSTPYGLYVAPRSDGNHVGITVGNSIPPVSSQSLESTSTIADAVFTHIAVTADGSSLRIYLDGRLDNSVAQTVVPFNSGYPLEIGSSAGSAPVFFDGVIDELQIYNRALAANEITAIFNGFDKGLCKGQIAFAKGVAGGQQDIFAMNPNGTGLTNLTNNMQNNAYPTWSPNGNQIAFEASSGDPGIYIMNTDGSALHKIPNTTVLNNSPAWSPDGIWIAFSDNTAQISKIKTDGTNLQQITHSATGASVPTWSPASLNKIAYAATNSTSGFPTIYVINADGSGSPIQLIPDNRYYTDPAWSPDGSSIAYVQLNNNPPFNPGIYVVNVSGGTPRRLTTTNADSHPAWSPDGTKIVFNRGSDIYVMDAATGSNLVRLTTTNNNHSPSWGAAMNVLSPAAPFKAAMHAEKATAAATKQAVGGTGTRRADRLFKSGRRMKQ